MLPTDGFFSDLTSEDGNKDDYTNKNSPSTQTSSGLNVDFVRRRRRATGQQQSPWDFQALLKMEKMTQQQKFDTYRREMEKRGHSVPSFMMAAHSSIDQKIDRVLSNYQIPRPRLNLNLFMDPVQNNEGDSSSNSKNIHQDSWKSLDLSKQLLHAVEDLGYLNPTAIQSKCIPLILDGKDILANAVTGSGKTASFVLPCLERLLSSPATHRGFRVLILAPSRELAIQCHSMIEKLAKYTNVTHCIIAGGLDSNNQKSALKQRPDIVVATPGRLIDHLINTPTFTLDTVNTLILDEADKLTSVQFIDQVEEIVRYYTTHTKRQTLLFSATLSSSVQNLARIAMKSKPIHVQIEDKHLRVAANLVSYVIRVKPNSQSVASYKLRGIISHEMNDLIEKASNDGDSDDDEQPQNMIKEDNNVPIITTIFNKFKTTSFDPETIVTEKSNTSRLTRKEKSRIDLLQREAILILLFSNPEFARGNIVFVRTKLQCHRLVILCGLAGLEACELHSDLSQLQRLEALESFKSGKKSILITTDVGARGLDIIGVETVVNFSMPVKIDDYVHRVGRTARAGRHGRAISLIGESDRAIFKLVDKICRKNESLSVLSLSPKNVALYIKFCDSIHPFYLWFLREEKVEKQLRQAAMDIRKAQNIDIHDEDIHAREKNEWFQTGTERNSTMETAQKHYQQLLQLQQVQNDKINGTSAAKSGNLKSSQFSWIEKSSETLINKALKSESDVKTASSKKKRGNSQKEEPKKQFWSARKKRERVALKSLKTSQKKRHR